MGYIGVSEKNEKNFNHRVIEARLPFSDYKCPNTKEEYWSTVEMYWKPLKKIVITYVENANNEMLDKLLQEKNVDLGSYFQNAWFSAPDRGSIHLIPAWHILCDLCSERSLLYE